jgi:DNA-binding Lrp family transcriptional regulator
MKGQYTFRDRDAESSRQYRAIGKCLAIFGYMSQEEIKFMFQIDRHKAHHRIQKLLDRGIIRRFPSLTVPPTFICLTSYGKDLVKKEGINEYVIDFVPSDYNLMWQNHHRSIIRVWWVLYETYKDNLHWVGEKQLQREVVRRRMFDGEFILEGIMKEWVDGDWGKEIVSRWVKKRFALEVELELKTPKRYVKQFEQLADELRRRVFYDKQPIDRVIYVYLTPTIYDRLERHKREQEQRGVKFYSDIGFVSYDDIITLRGEAEIKFSSGVRKVKELL